MWSRHIMANRASGDIPEVRLTLTQRLRRVETLVYRHSEILDRLIAHGHTDPPPELRALRDEMRQLTRERPRTRA